MAVNDTLCFADFDPVTGAPNIDGNVQPDLGVVTGEAIESGYVNGSRLTMGGSGFPPVIFQGVKSGNSLVLGFFCRGDLSFDGTPTYGDVLVLALRPSQANADQTTARRLDIFTVWDGIGAENPSANNPASPANTPDDFPGFGVRTNHLARKINFYKGAGGATPWTAASASGITGLQVRVRSWLPPIAAQTTSVGSQSTTDATLNVASTGPFANSGHLTILGKLVAYTGKTPTSFTGCTTQQAAVVIPAGTAVAIAECAWSVEVQIPISNGGADWISLADGFGLYFNIVRLGRTSGSGPTPSQTWFSTQFRFPTAVPGNTLTGTLDTSTNIDPSWYGTGLIPALQQPPGNNRGLGVFFTNDALSVGRRDLNSSTTTLTHEIQMPPNGSADNEIVALLSNSGPTDALGVTATTRMANWGLGPATFPAWGLPQGMSNNPTTPKPVPAGSSNVALASPWLMADVPNAYKNHDHQCIWVQLDAPNVNFVQSSVRRNMDFVGFSEVDRDAEISGVGYPQPASGNHHDFLLFTRARRIVSSKDRRMLAAAGIDAIAGGTAESADVVYVWITEGYRRTHQRLRIGSIDTEVLDESPGAFGYIGQHKGVDDGVAWEFAGPGLSGAGNVHQLKVPHNGSVVIRTRVRTTRPEEPKPAKWPWWIWLLLLIVLLVLIWLFR